jgi:hypothetical protein
MKSKMIKLTDLLKESTYVNPKGDIEDVKDFQISIEDGEIEDEDGNIIEGIEVQALYYDVEEGEYMDIGEYPNPKKYVASGDLEEYVTRLGATLWTKEPLEIYKGDYYNYEVNGYKTYGYEFETFEELENFMENDLKQELYTIYKE